MMHFIQRHFRKTLPYIARKNKEKYTVIQKRKFYAPRPPYDNNYMYYMFLIGFGILYANRRPRNPPAIC